uniref:Ig-like domain-containing protein n=1 Tax=Xenopus tropicalis TaxID=8364 RepID=A0A6I8R098_XENTR
MSESLLPCTHLLEVRSHLLLEFAASHSQNDLNNKFLTQLTISIYVGNHFLICTAKYCCSYVWYITVLNVVEGNTASLLCNYQESNFRSLIWYRQYPGEKLDLLIQTYNDGNKSEGRFTLQKKDKISFLYVPNTSVTDSASYVCATDALCETSYGSQCKNTVLLDASSQNNKWGIYRMNGQRQVPFLCAGLRWINYINM